MRSGASGSMPMTSSAIPLLKAAIAASIGVYLVAMPTPSSPSSVCRRTRISFARGTMKWLTQCGRSVWGARRMHPCSWVLFTWRLFLQVAVEELHGALPRLLGRFRVVLEHVELLRVCGLVGKGVFRVVAMELVLHVRALELLLELIHA